MKLQSADVLIFLLCQMSVSVAENAAGLEVVRVKVTDKDELGSPNANSQYSLIKGNEGGEFTITTGADKMEGILKTAKVGTHLSISIQKWCTQHADLHHSCPHHFQGAGF